MNWLPFGKRKRIGLVTQSASPTTAETTLPMNKQTAVGCGRKILVVDDDAVIIKTTSVKLKSQGYQVASALDAAEAVSAIRHERPDLILLDVSFPPDVSHGGGVAWDGFKIMVWLQRIEEAKDIPIIVISGSDPAVYKERALAAGAVAFFNKPIHHDKLLTLIAQVLQDKGDGPASAGN